ncbi:hypothetical protein [Goodfellowiella coeruleoviolacea]|uniref:Uncharacterized protein n=1 Tax=Goodfellowiella coeruleoviolacea TaxID=334858 RepID=A0AAE3GFU0_9PSEU|nr:hypothetical protein [Goodfellowiella coeruleoviolacea]MCP2167320.1 hypothetical protein [Goodfellowiella coeruleoviolacea]
MKTTRTPGTVGISIQNSANRVTSNGNAFLPVHTRVAVTDNGSSSATVPPGGAGPNLVRLTGPLWTVSHRARPATTTCGGRGQLRQRRRPADRIDAVVERAEHDTAHNQMAAHWNARLAETNTFSLPNTTC